jgi:acyl-CoA reductase-like NAD-dependent aldehyde dehydrogenase
MPAAVAAAAKFSILPKGRVARQVALAARADVDRAVTAAKAAAGDWGSAAPQRRARVMFAFRDLVEKYSKDIAALLTAEHGKTLPDALGEVQRGLEVIEFACGIPQLLKGQHSHGIGGGIDHWSQRMPLGVAAGITPFNFPFMVPMWMAPMALACGNTFVLKPSERDPFALAAGGRTAARSRPAGRRLQRGAGRQGSGGRPARASRTWMPCPSSARRRSRNTSRATASPTASVCRRWAGPRTTWW